ncbi:hypothetical protein CspHIS471_0608920 [Cutaneotrichosporon sp. HIS471]|nr:hypothetical protein CspHIS471_0608920 [Cutaneotrichosporon sp. HIS471]
MLRTRGGSSSTMTAMRSHPLATHRTLISQSWHAIVAVRDSEEDGVMDGSLDYFRTHLQSSTDEAAEETTDEESGVPHSKAKSSKGKGKGKARSACLYPTSNQHTTTKQPANGGTKTKTRTKTPTQAEIIKTHAQTPTETAIETSPKATPSSPPTLVISTSAETRPAAPAPENDPTPGGSRDQVDQPKDDQSGTPNRSPSLPPDDSITLAATTPPKCKSSTDPVECDFEEWRAEWNIRWRWIKDDLGAIGKKAKRARVRLDDLCDELEETECEHSPMIDNIASALTEINAFAGDALRIKSPVLVDTLQRRLTLLNVNINDVPAHSKHPRVEPADGEAVVSEVSEVAPDTTGGPSNE